MKIVKLLLALSVVVMLSGCAMSNTSKYPKYSYMYKLDNSANVVGGHTVDIIGPVTWKTEKQCSVLDFVTYATTKENNKAHDVINIRADETKKSTPSGSYEYTCKYWGLAVRYVPAAESPKPAVKGKLSFTVNDAEVSTVAD